MPEVPRHGASAHRFKKILPDMQIGYHAHGHSRVIGFARGLECPHPAHHAQQRRYQNKLNPHTREIADFVIRSNNYSAFWKFPFGS